MKIRWRSVLDIHEPTDLRIDKLLDLIFFILRVLHIPEFQYSQQFSHPVQ